MSYTTHPEQGGIAGSTGATDNSVLRSDGAGGATLQNSLVTIADTGGLTIPQGTITAAAPALSNTATWNNAGVTFSNIVSNITNTASAADSQLIDLQINGASKFSAGRQYLQSYTTSGAYIGGDGGFNTMFNVDNDANQFVFSASSTYPTINASSVGNWTYYRTITAAGTTGNQTINKPAGTVNFAAAASSLTVTNSIVTTSSIILCVVRTNDTTAILKNVVASAGSFVINLNAATTAETSVGFFVTN